MYGCARPNTDAATPVSRMNDHPPAIRNQEARDAPVSGEQNSGLVRASQVTAPFGDWLKGADDRNRFSLLGGVQNEGRDPRIN